MTADVFTPGYETFFSRVLIGHRGRIAALIQVALAKGRSYDFQCPIIRLDGRDRLVRVLS